MLVMHIQFHSNLPITSSVVGVEDGVSDSKLAMTVAFSSRDGLASLTLVDTYIRGVIALHLSYRTLPITPLLICGSSL